MKKIRLLIVSLALAVVMAIMLTACGSKQPSDISGTFTSGDITYTFAKDGTMMYSENGKSQLGTYTADNGKLVITINGEETWYDYTYDGDELGLYEKGSLFGTGYKKMAAGQDSVDPNREKESSTDETKESQVTKETTEATEETTEAETSDETTWETEENTEPETTYVEPDTEPYVEPETDSYDDGGSSYDDGGSSYDDGGSSYDDGGSSYDDGGSSYDDGGSSYDDGGNSYDDGGGSSGSGSSEQEHQSVPNGLYGDVVVGGTVKFGVYEQDNNTANGKEQIEWYVLAIDGNKALLLSKYGLDCQPFDTSGESVTWETSTIRKWLNDDFINTAFVSGEQDYIVKTTINEPDNRKYGTDSGNETEDQIFLLSYDEAQWYFGYVSDRILTPTEYAKAQGVTLETDEGNGYWWWLRTMGGDDMSASLVYPNGQLDELGSPFSDDENAVRPALWVTLWY